MMSTGAPNGAEPLVGAQPVPLLRGDALGSLPGVVHGFTTRDGGVSTGARATLDLSRRDGDDLRHNWARVAAALHPGLGPDDVAVVHQVHGPDVARVDAPRGPAEPLADADALVTTRAGVLLAVRVADCVPVLLAAPGGVAAAHAGWRGTVAGVVEAALRALCEATGADPAEVVAAVGPHITGASFEVGPEVVEGLRATGIPGEVFLRPVPGARDRVDLGAVVQAQLARAGVRLVDRVPGCTYREARFFSHRRDGATTGRMVGAIARLS